MLTKELVKELFDYKDGNLYWKKKLTKTSPIKIGYEVGTVMTDGYKRSHFLNGAHAVHRMIFLWHHGFLPKYVDHIDGNKVNNRIENLREITAIQNTYNRKIGKNNKSGVKGVFWSKNNRWIAQIRANGKVIYLGSYKELNEAEKAAKEGRSKAHGEFAKHA
jgi:hypothetical protein